MSDKPIAKLEVLLKDPIVIDQAGKARIYNDEWLNWSEIPFRSLTACDEHDTTEACGECITSWALDHHLRMTDIDGEAFYTPDMPDAAVAGPKAWGQYVMVQHSPFDADLIEYSHDFEVVVEGDTRTVGIDVYKIGGGTIGRTYTGTWGYRVTVRIDPPRVLMSGEDLETGHPVTHEQAVWDVLDFAAHYNVIGDGS